MSAASTAPPSSTTMTSGSLAIATFTASVSAMSTAVTMTPGSAASIRPRPSPIRGWL